MCEGGRSEAEFNSQGVGDRLLFQTADGYYAAPMTKVFLKYMNTNLCSHYLICCQCKFVNNN